MLDRKDIPAPRLTDPVPIPPEVRKTIELNFEYAIDKRNPFVRRVKAFIRGETKVGRKVGAFLDIATIFLPRAKSGREALKIILQRKQRAMPILKEKPWYESKTLWGAILVVLFALLQAVGVDPIGNPELTDTILQIAMIVSGAFGLYGLRSAIDEKRQELNK